MFTEFFFYSLIRWAPIEFVQYVKNCTYILLEFKQKQKRKYAFVCVCKRVWWKRIKVPSVFIHTFTIKMKKKTFSVIS